MKTKMVSLAALAACILSLAGCSGLAKFAQMSGSELMDLVAEPSHIYHSGHDLLSGHYMTRPLPGDTEHKAEPLSITKNEKGWEVKDDAAALGLHAYEMTPQEAGRGIHNFDEKRMQCLDQKYILRICAVPPGTKVRFEGKIRKSEHGEVNAHETYTATSKTGYVLLYNDGTWMHLVRR